jgi:hypothetical protein
MTLGVLAIIYIALILTPKVGKSIDDFIKNYREKHPKPEEDERLYLVKSPFDGGHQLDMDKLYEQEKARRETLNEEDTNSKNTLNDNGDVNKNG